MYLLAPTDFSQTKKSVDANHAILSAVHAVALGVQSAQLALVAVSCKRENVSEVVALVSTWSKVVMSAWRVMSLVSPAMDLVKADARHAHQIV